MEQNNKMFSNFVRLVGNLCNETNLTNEIFNCKSITVYIQQMKKRIIASMLIALTMAGGLFAETTQTLLINGEKVDKAVSSITFDGDNVVLHFGNETESHDMNLVSMTLDHTSGLNNVNLFEFNGKIVGGVLSVSGLDAGIPIYVYNLGGVAQVSAKADSEGKADIYVENLPGGIYVLQAGNNCVKFVKH